MEEKPNPTPRQAKVETSQPRGWILCALYVLVTAPLVAGLIAACSLVKASLSPEDVIDLTDGLVGVSLFVLQLGLAVGALQLVFAILQARFRVRPSREGEGIDLAPFGLALIAPLLPVGLLSAATHLGIHAEPLSSMDLLTPVLAFVSFGYLHLRSLLNPLGSPPYGWNQGSEPRSHVH